MSEQEDRPTHSPEGEPDEVVRQPESADTPGAGNAAAEGESMAEPQAEAQADQAEAPVEIAAEDSAKAAAVEVESEEEAARQAAQRAADEAVLAESRRRTRRSFVAAAVGAAAGYGFYRWIGNSPGVEMQPEPFRRVFEANAAIARGLTGGRALAPTYALKESRDLRVNGVYGLKRMLAPESWRLQVAGSTLDARHPRFAQDVTAWEYRYTEAGSHEDQGHDTKVDPNAKTAEKMAPAAMMEQAKAEEDRGGMPRGREEAGESRSTLMPGTPGLLLTMEDVLALPRYELVTQFKCIEGWSEIVHWAGARMADFMDAYPPQLIDGKQPKYVYMETPTETITPAMIWISAAIRRRFSLPR